MRITSTLLVALAGSLALSSTAPMAALAQPACSPAAPRGFVRAKIEGADGVGGVTLRFGAEAEGRLKPKVGDATYLITCGGFRAPGRGTYTTIQSVSGTSARAVLGLPASRLVGGWALIDTGYDSEPPLYEGEVRPPAGYVQASITDVQVKGGKTQIGIGGSYVDGVFPGARGYLVSEKGRPVPGGAFTVARLASEHLTVALVDASADVVSANQQVFVERSQRRCQAPDPVPPPTAELARTLQGGAPPAGWIFVDVPTTRSGWPSITLPVGADQGVVPPARAWFVVGRPAPGVPLSLVPASAGVEDIRSRTSMVTATESLRSAPMRVLVQVAKCR